MSTTRERFVRGKAISRKQSDLPAQIYNLCRILLHHDPRGAVFVPIRPMQYLAVIDREEIIFVDAPRSHNDIVLAWRRFRPGTRNALHEPVPYEIETYLPQRPEERLRLPGEFYRALRALEARDRPRTPAAVVPLRR